MQFIGVLLTLLAASWLTMTQLNKPASQDNTATSETGIQAPQSLQDLKRFEQDVNATVQQNADQQRQQLEAQ